MHELLFKDFWWKLFSLVLAAFIWLTVDKLIEDPQASGGSISNVTANDYELPVLIVATAADMHLYHVAPDQVVVTASAPASVDLKASQIRVTVDLSNLTPTNGATEPVNVSLPSGVTLIKVWPPSVNVIVPPKP